VPEAKTVKGRRRWSTKKQKMNRFMRVIVFKIFGSKFKKSIFAGNTTKMERNFQLFEAVLDRRVVVA
jgi:hypothetical protein